MGRNLREYRLLSPLGVTWLSRISLLCVSVLVGLVSLSETARAQAQESEPAPDRSVEIGLGLRFGASNKTGLMALALDAYVPRYFVGLRAEAAGNIDILGGGNRESFALVSVGVAHQQPIPRTNLSLSLFAGPTLGSMSLDWRQPGFFSSCEPRCAPEPHHNPALGTYFVYGAQVAVSISIHIGGFFIGISGSGSIVSVGGTEHLHGLYGSRLGFSL